MNIIALIYNQHLDLPFESLFQMTPTISKGNPATQASSSSNQSSPPLSRNLDGEYREPMRIRNARKRWEERKAAMKGKTLLEIDPPVSKENSGEPDPIAMILSACSPNATVSKLMSSSAKKLHDSDNVANEKKGGVLVSLMNKEEVMNVNKVRKKCIFLFTNIGMLRGFKDKLINFV